MRLTVADVQRRKVEGGPPLVMLTAYDWPSARILDEAGVDILLVGDSLGMVVLGHDTTLPVTVDDMVRHAGAVVRGSHRALVVADMPFLSYQLGEQEALRNAGRLVVEAGVQAVKLEGGRAVAPTVRRLTSAGIPVMGHLGLTPQAVHRLGGYRLQARTRAEAEELLEDAQTLVEAGVFALVLEMVPAGLARVVTERVPVPTIGIGAGEGCDGQVLVLHDVVNLSPGPHPRFVRQYADLSTALREAVRRYADDVRSRRYPSAEESFQGPAELAAWLAELEGQES